MVTTEENDKTTRQLKKVVGRLEDNHWKEVLGILLSCLLLFIAASWGISHSPTPRLSSLTPNNLFSAERALSHVKKLATEIGYRVVGSRGLEQGQKYILEELNHISNAGRPDCCSISVDRQVVSGMYQVKLNSLGNFTFHTVYTDIENIIVKIDPNSMEARSKKTLLLNCHTDSAVGSPGASDDASGCGVMLEIINNILSDDCLLQRPVLFLFNGAEEPVLDGAHGFVSHHPWAKEVAALINLESCGSGGLALLFRSGPKNGWLSRAYAKSVKRPHGSSVSQDFFEADLIPAETDFRVFWEEASIPGIDLANYQNGQTYHTPRDATDRVPLETLQHMGETAYNLLLELAVENDWIDQAVNSSTMQNERVIFHDILGLYSVIYSEQTGNFLFWALSIFGIVLIFYKVQRIGWKHFLNCLATLLLSVCGALSATLAVGWFVSVTYIRSMSWFHRTGVAYLIYGSVLTFWFLFLLHYSLGSYDPIVYQSFKNKEELERYLFERRKKENVQSEAMLAVHVLLEWFLLTLFLYFRLSSVYMYAWTVIGGCLAMYPFSKNWNLRFLSYFIPIALFKAPVFWIAVSVFLPIMGRAGVDVLADVVAAGFIALFRFHVF
eukprot:jgi/Galph1/352/GphlegSOOS_G5127.1